MQRLGVAIFFLQVTSAIQNFLLKTRKKMKMRFKILIENAAMGTDKSIRNLVNPNQFRLVITLFRQIKLALNRIPFDAKSTGKV